MDFTKYHVCNCDFIVSISALGTDARAVCARHTGAGASGLVKVRENPFRANFFRPDGMETPLDVSALMCAAAFLCEKCGTPKISIMTGGGVCEAEIMPQGEVCVALPETAHTAGKMRRADISPPTEYAKMDFFGAQRAFCPTDDIWNAILFGLGEKMSVYRAFPSGADVDLVRLTGKNKIEVRSYERGAGYVTSVSGAVAATLRLYATGKCGGDVSVTVDCGKMSVHIGRRVRVLASVTKIMTGKM